MNTIFVVGINHRYSPVHFRERLAFSQKDLSSALADLRHVKTLGESLVLSTCNRVEVYGVTSDIDGARQEVLQFLAASRKVGVDLLRKSAYGYEADQAVRHLFRVASGLDSMVVGETEILGQVKDAFRLASQAGNVRSLLHQLCERAFRAAKQVRQETKIAAGAVSVSSVAVELARKIFGRLSREKILVLGTGKMSESTLKRLMSAGALTIRVASRNPERARELAEKYEVETISFEAWKHFLKETDIVISSTAAPHPVIRYEDVKQVMGLRRHKPLFIIDIAVPRDAEESINSLDDVYLYNIDDLKSLCEANLSTRKKEIEKCEAIVEKKSEEFLHWMRTLDSAPTIRKLKVYMDQIIARELEIARRTESPERVAWLERILERVKGRLLHDPLSKLKEAGAHGGGYHYHEVLETLFDLEKVKIVEHEDQESEDREPREQAGSFTS